MSLYLELQLEAVSVLGQTIPAVLSCLQPAAGACEKPKLLMIVPLKIFSAIGIQELPEVKIGS